MHAHAKDVVLERRLVTHIDERPAGQGLLDLPTFMRRMEGLGPRKNTASESIRCLEQRGGEEIALIYELRSYDIDPPLLDNYLAWANDQALPILVGQFGFRLVGFWHAVAPGQPEADGVPPTNVHWIIAWQNEDEMLSKWTAARASNEWQAINVGRPKFHLKVQSTQLRAIPRSPFQ